MKTMRRLSIGCLAVAFLAAAPARDAERSIVEGNRAFVNGDYDGAVDRYTRAEEYTTDPGLVAFNQAATLYRLGHYREAEEHYLRCLEGANGERLTNALYNLGNAVLQQAGTSEAKRIQRAIRYYEECLNRNPAGDLAENARFNLKIARALLAQARANPRQGDRDPRDSGSGSSDPDRDPTRQALQPGAGQNMAIGQASMQRRVGDHGQQPRSSNQTPPPGVGDLPPIEDRDETVRLSPEDTARYLDQVAERVRRERQDLRRQSSPPSAKSWKDW